MTSPFDAVYEKYKHLDSCLSDPEWCTSGEGAAIYAIAGELWRAVKEAREKPRPPCEECHINSIIEQKRGCLTCRDPECPVWQAADQNCWKSQEGRDDAIRQDERDKIYKRLEAMRTEAELVTCVTWADIDCLFAELKDGEPK